MGGGVLLLALGASCNQARPPNVTSNGAAGGSGAGGAAGTTAADAGVRPDGAGGATPDAAADQAPGETLPPGTDPGLVTMHRLTNFEYDNTVRDLLGVKTSPAASFEDDAVEGAPGAFDNAAEGLHMSPSRYQHDLGAAKALADAVWSDAALKGRILTCAGDASGQCARSIVAAFGLRAWRRPLTDGEAAALGAFADAALADTGDFSAAMKRVVTLMLSSLPFLYKIEIDPSPTSTAPHALTGYELASRLAYLLWSSMPDDALLALGDGLRRDDVLAAQLERMLDDPKADAFVQSFAGQWLGVRDLATHVVDPSIFPDWDDVLPQSMAEEMSLYFREFLDRSFDGFLTADLHFVDARLGVHYGLVAPPTGAVFARVDLVPESHTGFLGLAGFLTVTSLPYRTSPSARGSWVLEHLLCDAPPPPPHGDVPPSLDATGVAVDTRAALTRTFTDASCGACHGTFDGVGFALEHFDTVGQFRSNYSETAPIDASGSLADGTAFDGATALAAALANEPRVATCAVRKALGYALGRLLDDGDEDRVAKLASSWHQGTFRDLLRAIVLSDAFRLRRGEAP
jgi:hypothetical protein